MGDLDEAKADLMAAAKLDPKSREVRAELEELKVKLGAQRAKEKNTFGETLVACSSETCLCNLCSLN